MVSGWAYRALVTVVLCVVPGLSAAGGTKVVGVEVEGGRAFSVREIRRWLSTKPGHPLDRGAIERDVAEITRRYMEAGYWMASVGEPDIVEVPDGVRVTFRIDEGPRARVGHVAVEGTELVKPSEALELAGIGPGSPIDRGSLDLGIGRLLDFYSDRGYPLCSVSPEDFRIGPDGSVSFRLRVSEGPFVRIGAVKFSGNTFTKAGLLERYFGIREGEAYSQRKVDSGLRRLSQLGFIEVTSPPKLLYSPEDGLGTVLVGVREIESNSASGLIGYSPGPGRGGGFTGFLDISLGNLFGTGRSLSASWARRERNSSELHLSYREPWAFGLPADLVASLSQMQLPLGGDGGVYVITSWSASASTPISTNRQAGPGSGDSPHVMMPPTIRSSPGAASSTRGPWSSPSRGTTAPGGSRPGKWGHAG